MHQTYAVTGNNRQLCKWIPSFFTTIFYAAWPRAGDSRHIYASYDNTPPHTRVINNRGEFEFEWAHVIGFRWRCYMYGFVVKSGLNTIHWLTKSSVACVSCANDSKTVGYAAAVKLQYLNIHGLIQRNDAALKLAHRVHASQNKHTVKHYQDSGVWQNYINGHACALRKPRLQHWFVFMRGVPAILVN